MQRHIHWELSVLEKAVHFPNLSTASLHVGLSQPQLSRIIARIEDVLRLRLLDRTVKRRSAWTPEAFRVVKAYTRSVTVLESEIQTITGAIDPERISIGTLEGLIPLATEFCSFMNSCSRVQTFSLDVYDLSDLEEHFLKAELDFIFTSHEPGPKKYTYQRVLGRQRFEFFESTKPEELKVLSPFEFQSQKNRKHPSRTKEAPQKILLSNSLAVRRHWLKNHGGTGALPSEILPKSNSRSSIQEGHQDIFLIGAEHLNILFWQKVSGYTLKKRVV